MKRQEGRLNEIEVEMGTLCEELKKAEEGKGKKKLLREACDLMGEFDDLTHIRVEIPGVPATTRKMNTKLRRAAYAAVAGR